jgi:hypothetical protein
MAALFAGQLLARAQLRQFWISSSGTKLLLRDSTAFWGEHLPVEKIGNGSGRGSSVVVSLFRVSPQVGGELSGNIMWDYQAFEA